ncbi:MAG: hypothetical protein IPM95_04130 [Sphingobacteriales bacterium]|nr:hypothetical protein [Sphingobacteriales bacterium]
MENIPFIAFLYGIILIIGIVLAVYYLYIERGITDKNEFLHLLFFAPTGFGNWKYNSIIRRNQTTEHSKKWYTYKYMIRINWCIIAALLIYEIYTFYHLYQMLVHYNEFKDNASATVGTNAADVLYSSFGWMINLSVYIVLAFMAIVLFFSFLVCILLFILLPKLLFKNK